jgi:CxxC motif-containing protein (DUF1111 family)
MKRLILIVATGTGLLACNGGSDTDTAAATETPQATVGDTSTAAATANAVRDTIEGFSRPGGGSGGTTTFTPRPSRARDPGPRSGPADAGQPYATLTSAQRAVFDDSKTDFEEAEDVAEGGLGPTFNLDSCGGCHAHPASGGTSPPVNPQVAVATKLGAKNTLPSFITPNGPVREVRFVRNADGSPDGGVHGLFTIAGRSDALGCKLAQPDFAAELASNNVIFRIPTPTFGLGLIEAIPDSEILKNQAASTSAKQALGIRGRPNIVLSGNSISGQANHNGNDGTIARFGWKAQNKSLLIFSGEAYNVEMGISNEAFPTERDETDGCLFAQTPNSEPHLDGASATASLSAITKFTMFMRMLAPPTRSNNVTGATADSIAAGNQLFSTVGCALCHSPSLKTYKYASAATMGGVSGSPNGPPTAVNLFSDLLIHDMGVGLADGIQQGQAGGREFRSAPLWGLGQRLFFLHDGRTNDLRQAIFQHFSSGSEANAVTRAFDALPDAQQQNLLNFLRSL